MTGADVIHHRVMGQGPERALALHCGLGSSAMFKPLGAALGGRMTITAPDFPGHGRSRPFEDLTRVHDEATEVVRDLFTDGMHLIGHSFGATVALRLALEGRFRPASMTLVEPVFFAAARGSEEHARHRANEEAFFAVYQNGDMLEAARCFNRIWGGGIKWDQFRAVEQEGMALGMPFVVATEASLWLDTHDMLAPGGLERLDCPVTLLRGSETVPIVAEVHAGLMARLPNAREIVVEGAGHMLVRTHPEALISAVAEQPGYAPA